MITVEQIKQNISEAIKHSGKTQTAIAKEIKVSNQTISSYVKQEKMPALDTFANLCVAIDADPADILCVNGQ